MSDTGGVTNRNRRRAVRSEGPPPEAGADTARVHPATASTAAEEVAATPPTVELDKPEQAPAAEPAAHHERTESAAAPVTLGKTAAAEPVRLDKAAESDEAETIPQPPAAGGAVLPVPPAPPSAAAVASEGPAAPSAAGGGWQRIVAVAAVLLAVALMGGTGYLVHLRGEIAAENTLRADYVQTAKQAMLNITNISAETASDDIKRVLEVTSGELAAEYEQRKDDYAGIVQKAEVRAKGEVIDAAIESSDDHSAIVLVAVKQTLTNAGAEGPQQRQFRFRVTITHTERGLAATQMEMVI
ncbi:hypothetical protein FOH10_28385 [Nocardia otitidiscaviarum]|uniref:Mce protein n=1 Tax=Nocardia otitidiscaviarum TaxID=1823 RepID=A0A516NT37_9NOCA|nr:hypothetical protein [Nocardia otitidiscaviarum]MCP9621354.1 hypothetical protein [Nocardia otitidiscaviarum]QDP82065.1 hypothetical protein FOH10_28385 [Nocardia otitidiscaviarum]